jgi:hypothetical protein
MDGYCGKATGFRHSETRKSTLEVRPQVSTVEQQDPCRKANDERWSGKRQIDPGAIHTQPLSSHLVLLSAIYEV